MIPEIDIWRAASLMLKRYGEKALEESTARAVSFSPSRTTTVPQCGAGSSTPSASSPTRRRLAGSTDQLEFHSAGRIDLAGHPLFLAPRFIIENKHRGRAGATQAAWHMLKHRRGP
jgi:hypothetical protein